MPDRSRKPRPRDSNQLAKMIVDIASGDVEDKPARKPSANELVKADGTPKDPAAVALGRKGGLKGGKARAEALSARKRKEIAKKAAAKRWSKV